MRQVRMSLNDDRKEIYPQYDSRVVIYDCSTLYMIGCSHFPPMSLYGAGVGLVLLERRHAFRC